MTNDKPKPDVDIEKWCGLVAAIVVGNLLTVIIVYFFMRGVGGGFS